MGWRFGAQYKAVKEFFDIAINSLMTVSHTLNWLKHSLWQAGRQETFGFNILLLILCVGGTLLLIQG